MIPNRIKQRLRKDRPMTAITLRVPEDVIDSLKEIAPKLGFSGYQALIKAYVSEGLRRDEAKFVFGQARQLADILKKKGLDAKVIEEAMKQVAA